MNKILLVSILCPDKPGLISAITGLLFDLDINLADTSFAVLGEGSEFTAICEVPATLAPDRLAEHLRGLDEVENADIKVTPFKWSVQQKTAGTITHRIVLQGHDQPGLVARLTEVFRDYAANIVRMDTKALPDGADRDYLIELAVSIPPERTESCLATVGNTAASLNMKSDWVEVKK